jgi:glycosyltransferase involved in cell wall biosynthesis
MGLTVNIWFAANIPQESCGGVARSMRGLSEGLRQGHGFDTEIVYGFRGRIRGNYLFFACSLCLRLLLHVKNPPRWIIARSTDGVFCAIAARTLGIKTKIALHNHGWEEIAYCIEKKLPADFVGARSTWRARFIRFPLLRTAIFFCDRCISGTLCETRWLAKRYPLGRKKYAYIPNGVAVGSEALWESRGASGENAFLSVGGNTWKKNLGNTIGVFKNIVARLPDANLVLVGTGGNIKYFSEELRDYRRNYLIVPLENPDGMATWYEKCPYLISSSRYEGGHSLAILEAMSFGCVVFATDIPSTREIIVDKKNGVFIGGHSAEEDARTILEVVADRELVARIRTGAFHSARRARWSRQVGRLKAVLCLE